MTARRESVKSMVAGALVSQEQSRHRPRQRTPRVALTRDQVVDAAVHVLETDGYPALSMRRVAQDLQVGTMSLYWHVADREELLDLVFERVIREQVLDDVPDDWREALHAIAWGARRMFERFPWILDIGPRPRIGTVVLEHVEQSIAATEGTGLPMAARLAAISAVDHYVLGYAVQEHVRPSGDGQMEVTAAGDEALRSGRFPRAAGLLDEHDRHPPYPAEDEFDVGLAMLLDGIAAAVERGGLPGVPTPVTSARRPARA